MTYISQTEFLIEVEKGLIPGHSLIHKFGRNDSTGTTLEPVTMGGVYQTPQAASATTVRVKAGGNANDTAAGTGAREVTFIGLDETGVVITEAVATAGASASAATTATFMRIYRAYVSASGTYATAIAGSHAGDIVIENGSGGTDWLTIDSTIFPMGQTEIGVFSVPIATTAYILRANAFADSTKTTDLIFFCRGGIMESAAPYSRMNPLFTLSLKGGHAPWESSSGVRVAGPADMGFMAQVGVGTAVVAVDFEILLVAD